MPRPFAVSLRTEGDSSVVFVSGEVDLNVCVKVAEVARLAVASQTSAVIVDLSDLTFIDSQGLNAMVRVREVAAERGKAFSLRNAPEPTQRLLKLAGLEFLLGSE